MNGTTSVAILYYCLKKQENVGDKQNASWMSPLNLLKASFGEGPWKHFALLGEIIDHNTAL